MNFKRKLWWAQHRTDVYKYGTILSLVLIVTISIIYFTYSKFTSKNEMTAYETTVEPFIKNDYFIASYIDGEWSNEIPGKDDGYVVDKIVCDNGATATWDNEEWGINIRNATKKIKCSVFFIVKPTSAKQIETLAATDTTNFATDDPDNNIRYIGANPNNYVYFNCNDYLNQSDDTCEKWRIIGVFKNVNKADGTKEDLVKIIRDDTIGFFAWDYKGTGVGTSTTDNGSNDWTDSQLMMMLNPTDYLKSGYTIDNNIVKDSKGHAIYQNMGSYYNGVSGCKPVSITSGSNFNCTSIDFTTTGLKNDTTRNIIESVIWNLGGQTNMDASVETFYADERSTTVYSNRPTTWIGKIGLMYPSDFGYAPAGGRGTGKEVSRSDCLSSMLSTLTATTAMICYGSDYLFKGDRSVSRSGYWTITPYSSRADKVYFLRPPSNLNASNSLHNAAGVRPVIFLKSSLSISGGAGSETNPYQLSLIN